MFINRLFYSFLFVTMFTLSTHGLPIVNPVDHNKRHIVIWSLLWAKHLNLVYVIEISDPPSIWLPDHTRSFISHMYWTWRVSARHSWRSVIGTCSGLELTRVRNIFGSQAWTEIEHRASEPVSNTDIKWRQNVWPTTKWFFCVYKNYKNNKKTKIKKTNTCKENDHRYGFPVWF